MLAALTAPIPINPNRISAISLTNPDTADVIEGRLETNAAVNATTANPVGPNASAIAAPALSTARIVGSFCAISLTVVFSLSPLLAI